MRFPFLVGRLNNTYYWVPLKINNGRDDADLLSLLVILGDILNTFSICCFFVVRRVRFFILTSIDRFTQNALNFVPNTWKIFPVFVQSRSPSIWNASLSSSDIRSVSLYMRFEENVSMYISRMNKHPLSQNETAIIFIFVITWSIFRQI